MRYVVIGASAAGISGAKTLRELDKEAEIVLVSKDENVYSRCILHHYISKKFFGVKSKASISLLPSKK